MRTALILFLLTAIGGLAMAGLRFAGTPLPPLWMPVIHGVLAAAGIVALIAATHGLSLASLRNVALVAFILAAIGGGVMFFGYHLRDMALPVPIIIPHAAAAMIGIGALIAIVARSHATPPVR